MFTQKYESPALVGATLPSEARGRIGLVCFLLEQSSPLREQLHALVISQKLKVIRVILKHLHLIHKNRTQLALQVPKDLNTLLKKKQTGATQKCFKIFPI